MGAGVASLTARAPSSTSISPANKTIQDSGTLRIAFTVRDDGSGLRHDGEFVNMPRDADDDPERSNLDTDQVYEGEPLSNANGGSQDIGVLIAGLAPWRYQRLPRC